MKEANSQLTEAQKKALDAAVEMTLKKYRKTLEKLAQT
jgi:hypothetical protein